MGRGLGCMGSRVEKIDLNNFTAWEIGEFTISRNHGLGKISRELGKIANNFAEKVPGVWENIPRLVGHG